MVTNNQVREAIKKLIAKYKDVSMSNTYGSISKCSLCNLFEITFERGSPRDCMATACPNNAFKGLGYSYDFPCVQRSRKFLTLDWNMRQNKLIKFWSVVLEIIPANDDTFICDESMQNKILKIAEKVNK